MKQNQSELYKTALLRSGYFTAREAEAAGFNTKNHYRMVERGEWERGGHGIYRLAVAPEDRFGEYHRWSLWSRDRTGQSEAVFAYETAFAIFGISDLQPAKIHLSVPRSFQRSVVPEVLKLHREDRDRSSVMDWEGLRVVRPLSAVIEMLREERVSLEHIERGLQDAVRRGLCTTDELDRAPLTPRERRLIEDWLKRR